MRNLLNLLVGLAAFTAVWGLAIVIVTVAVLVACWIGIISAPIVSILLAVATIVLVAIAVSRRQWIGAIFWFLTLGSGSIAAAFGPGPLAIWGLVVSGVIAIVAMIPGAILPGIRPVVKFLLVINASLSFALIAREVGWSIGSWTLLAVLLLGWLSWLLAAGSYRPREIRRTQRLLSRWVMLAAAVILLWQSVLVPLGQWLSTIGQGVATSPLGHWYRSISARAERVEIGEISKTKALRQLAPELQRAHEARWKKGIEQIPNLPLSPQEWGDLGIPREADP